MKQTLRLQWGPYPIRFSSEDARPLEILRRWTGAMAAQFPASRKPRLRFEIRKRKTKRSGGGRREFSWETFHRRFRWVNQRGQGGRGRQREQGGQGGCWRLKPHPGLEALFSTGLKPALLQLIYDPLDPALKEALPLFLTQTLIACFVFLGSPALHAAAYGDRKRRGTGTLVAGESGAGKTTLLLNHLMRGATFLADDFVFLFHREGRIWAFSATDQINLSEDMLLRFKPLGFLKDRPLARRWDGKKKKSFYAREIPKIKFASSLPVKELILLEKRGEKRGQAGVTACPLFLNSRRERKSKPSSSLPALLTLLPQSTFHPFDPHITQQEFDLVAALAESIRKGDRLE